MTEFDDLPAATFRATKQALFDFAVEDYFTFKVFGLIDNDIADTKSVKEH